MKARKIRKDKFFFINKNKTKMSQSYDIYKYISEYATSVLSMSVLDQLLYK